MNMAHPVLERKRSAAACIHPRVAQDLARHSDINLTMGFYTHVALEQRGEGIAKLPDVSPVEIVAVKNGTDDLSYRCLTALCTVMRQILKRSRRTLADVLRMKREANSGT